MRIIYARPDHLDDEQIDPAAPPADMAPNADVDPRVPICGATTHDVDGDRWTCTRTPEHPDDEHRSVFDRYRGGPVGQIGLAWRNEPDTAPPSGLRDTGTEPPFTLAQTLTWTELRAEWAHAAAEHWAKGSPKHTQHTRDADRFDAIAAELHRLQALDTTAR